MISYQNLFCFIVCVTFVPLSQCICLQEPCIVNGGWSEWSLWGACSNTCGSGTSSRMRSCNNPSPQNGGSNCVGESTQNTDCINNPPCSVDGGWTNWGAWGQCSVTCGGGVSTSFRSCTNPAPLNGGKTCEGSGSKTQVCNSDPCPINGGWSSWTAWSCSQTCGGGTSTRQRTCNNPSPQYGGAECSGSATESTTCSNSPCPVNGAWASWASWGTCSVTCGGGNQNRTRSCTNPSPAYGGSSCSGNAAETQTCNTNPCPIDGGWSTWAEWSTCSVSCGPGTKTRLRSCNSPAPMYGGNSCSGSGTESTTCSIVECPIDGQWATWGSWGTCSKTCGPNGTQTRSRTCTNPPPQYGGQACPSSATATQSCNTNINCPVDGVWSDWSNWNTCTVSCGVGTHTRNRTCIGPLYNGLPCVGNISQTENCPNLPNCPIDGVWNSWSAWSSCSVTCSVGQKNRSRTCTTPQYGGKICNGPSYDVTSCTLVANCPINGVWLSWSSWSTCSQTCAVGSMSRTRACIAPQYNGLPCSGSYNETTNCTIKPNCPIDGGLSSWTTWSECSSSCGNGTKTRTRQCNNPIPQYGGLDCTGDTTDSKDCFLKNCPVNGAWGDWGDWSTCSESCGSGIQKRYRYCDSPSPKYGGNYCISCYLTTPIPDLPPCSQYQNFTTDEPANFEWLPEEMEQNCTLASCTGALENEATNAIANLVVTSTSDAMNQVSALVDEISNKLADSVQPGQSLVLNGDGVSIGVAKSSDSNIQAKKMESDGLGGASVNCPHTGEGSVSLVFSSLNSSKILVNASEDETASPITRIEMKSDNQSLIQPPNTEVHFSLNNLNGQTEDAMLQTTNLSNSQKMIQQLTVNSTYSFIKLTIQLHSSARMLLLFGLNFAPNFTWQANVTAFIDETGFANVTLNGTFVVNFTVSGQKVRVSVPSKQMNTTDILYMVTQIFVLSNSTDEGSNGNGPAAQLSSDDLQTTLAPPPASFAIGVAILTPRSWSNLMSDWEDADVDIDPDSDISQVKFKSNFFGCFSSKMFIGPNTIDFADVFGNFGAKLANSFAILLTLIIIFIGYILLGVYMWRLDRNEADLLRFEPLVDNDQHHEYTYIVTFYTSDISEAGTSSNVFFNLAGAWGLSGQHLCHDGWRKKTFARGAVTNFVLTTEASLGELRALRVWHDGTGDFPVWHLQKVMIEDVQTRTMYVFMCDQWLAEDRFDGERERVLCEIKRDKKFQDLFLAMKMGGVLDKHVFMSLTNKSGDSSYTRLQRLSVCVAMFFLLMVSNAMYFGKSEDLPSDANFSLDFGPISMTWFQMYTSIISMAITYPCIFICAEIFRRTKRWQRRWTEDEMKKQRKEIQLPRFFLVLAWMLLITAIAVSSFFVFLYSLSWGNQKSTSWLMTFITGLVGMVFMTDPLMLLILYVLIKKITGAKDEENEMEMDQFVSEDINQALGHEVKGRNQEKMAEMQKEKANSQKMQRTFMDMISFILFTFLLTALAYDSRDPTIFRQNSQLKNYYISGDKFSTIQDVYNYVLNTAIPGIYPQLDFYGNPRTDDLKNTILNCDCLRLGPFRLRQLRARKGSCSTPYPLGSFVGSHLCYPNYAKEILDTDVYDPTWKAYSKPAFNRTSWKHRYPSPPEAVVDAFRYQAAQDSGGYPFEGVHGMYEGGGYVATLGTSMTQANYITQNLQNLYWLDRQTRALFLEGTVYNWNSNLFTTIQVLFEFPGGGGVIPFGFGVRTYRLYNYVGGKGMVLMMMQGAFILITIINIIRETRKVYKEKKEYFKSNWNIIEWINIIISLAILITTGVRIKLTIDGVETMMNNKGFYVAFDNAAMWVETSCMAMAFSNFVCIMRVLKYLGFNKHIAIVQATIAHSMMQLSSFGFILACFFFSYICCGNILFSMIEILFSNPLTMARSLFGVFLGVIPFGTMFASTGLSFVNLIYFYSWATLSLFILMSVFIAILNGSYSAVVESELYNYDKELVDHMFTTFSKMLSNVNKTVQQVVKRKPKSEDNNILSTASIRVELSDYRTKEDRYKKLHPNVQQKLMEMNNDKIDLSKIQTSAGHVERTDSFMSLDGRPTSNVLIRPGEFSDIQSRAVGGGGGQDPIPKHRKNQRHFSEEDSANEEEVNTARTTISTTTTKETFRFADGNALTIPMPNRLATNDDKKKPAKQDWNRHADEMEDEFNC